MTDFQQQAREILDRLAFTWAWLDLYPASDVRIAIERLDQWGKPELLLELEAILLRATEPPYNVKITVKR
jgi:hypothetical protein